MKNRIFAVLFAAVFSAAGLFIPRNGNAGVDVHITIPLPGLVIPAPPAMIVIPGTNVYYPPDVGVNIFFYHGYWYRPHRGQWFISSGYNGPWRGIAARRVPPVMHRIPTRYRHTSPRYGRVPYGQVKRNWRHWERDRYWDRHEKNRHRRGDDDRGEHRGRGHRR